MWQTISVREGSEPDSFWNALGGKAEYSRNKRIKGHREDPNLFSGDLWGRSSILAYLMPCTFISIPIFLINFLGIGRNSLRWISCLNDFLQRLLYVLFWRGRNPSFLLIFLNGIPQRQM
ncbi:hypothetical protein CFOL_v3_31256 [Cephalotus follicularis]|uniref:Uncharacterized protein n=1 Tax=Cephalotus follicularis TaxID=3775 RepID=A0A1Q3D5T0_CEPFO|nr:hypothetical protein CFOL_v3_31256 [Cephalotus follicularis]